MKILDLIKRAGFVLAAALMLTGVTAQCVETAQAKVVVRYAGATNNTTTTTTQNKITEVSDKASTEVIGTVKSVIEQWFPPIFIITLAAWALTKNDRTKDVFKRALIGEGITYAAVFAIDTIKSILQAAGGWFK